MALNDILTGLQVPPEIGIADFGREQTQQTNTAKQQYGYRQPSPFARRIFFRTLCGFGALRGTRAAHGRRNIQA